MKKILLSVFIICGSISGNGQNPAAFNITYTGFTPQAQTAFSYAANIWTQTLESTVPIKVNAYFTPLVPGLLGITLPNGIKDFPGAPMDSTWYATSLANSITGTELNPGQFDMDLFLNSSINWYTDTVGTVPAGQYDLVSVVLHELGHGLGFASLAKKSGTEGSFGLLQASDFAPIVTSFPWPALDTLPGVLDRFLVNSLLHPLDTFTNPSIALGAQLTNNNIYFNGSNALAANGNIKPRMYAPSSFSLGSSILHLNEITYPAGNINELMTPNAIPGNANHNPGPICIGILKDIGWTINPNVGIAENRRMKQEVVLYPNPADAFIYVQLGEIKNVAGITIINVFGEVVIEESEAGKNQNKNFALDIRQLSRGIYFMQIEATDISIVKKFIVH